MDAPDAVYVDALPLLTAAMAELGPGELVKTDLGLMELMGAVEIMDARTDSFLAAKAMDRAGLPSFDPTLELLPTELVWVLDELLRLEVTFLDGHPLVSTLFTCLYLRPTALAQVSSASTTSTDPLRLPGFRNVVLRAMLLGVLKCAEIVWEELCKGLVYEHEDVHLSLASLNFSTLLASAYPPTPPSPLRVQPTEPAEERLVPVDDVLIALEDAATWVQSHVPEGPVREALIGRISLRLDLTYALALLTSPAHTTPATLSAHYSRLLAWIPSLSTPLPLPPSPALRAIFAPSTDPPLPTNQPVREIEPVGLDEAWKGFGEMVEGLKSAAAVWEGWRSGTGWAGVREYHVSLSRRQLNPYVRSIHQSITFTSRTLFGTSPALSLPSSFFATLAGVPPSLWDALSEIRETETTWNAPARRVLGWADRVAGTLVQVLGIGCQNRARGRRMIVKTRGMMEQLIDESREFVPIIESLLPGLQSPSLLPTALHSLLLSQLLDVLLSGFELSLYDPEEWARVWWVSERVAGELERVFGELSGEYARAKVLETRGVRSMCRGAMLSAVSLPAGVPRIKSPILGFEEEEAMDKARFGRRFGFLSRVARGEELASWEEFGREMARLAAEEPANVAQSAVLAYQEAVTAFTAFAAIPLTARGCFVQPEHQLRWIAAFRRTSFANQNFFAARIKHAEVGGTAETRWDSAWFPIWK